MAKRALCIGINDYPGSGMDLRGCVNDATDWQQVFERRRFSIEMLLDRAATKRAMRRSIEQLIAETGPRDVAVLTFSGHGTWLPDTDGDEPDAIDEALCPYDIMRNRPFLDDELHEILSQQAAGARVVVIADSCFSGTVATMAPAAQEEVESTSRVRFLPPSLFLKGEAVRVGAGRVRPVTSPKSTRTIQLAACQEYEYSYEGDFRGRPSGAFTFYARRVLRHLEPTATYVNWMLKVRRELPSQTYPQSPRLVASRRQRALRVFR